MTKFSRFFLAFLVCILAMRIQTASSYISKPQHFLISSTVSMDPSDDSSSSLESSSSSSEESSSFSDSGILKLDIDPEEIYTVLSFTRHGAATDKNMIYDGEWKPYKIENFYEDDEQLTILGEAQCWSSGYRLLQMYPDLVEDALNENTYRVVVGPRLKTSLCGLRYLNGLFDEIWDTGYYFSDSVRRAMIQHGNCHNCLSDIAFPFDESQISSDHPKLKGSMDLLTIKPDAFLDLDDLCYKRFKFLEYEVEDISKQDSRFFRQNVKTFSDGVNSAQATQMLFKHIYHNLKQLPVSEKLTKRVLKSRDGLTDDWVNSLFKVHETDWRFVALFARTLIVEILKRIDHPHFTLASYVVHNNNMLGLVMFLVGVEECRLNTKQVIPYYASNLDLILWQDSETQVKYVALSKDGVFLPMRNCQDGYCDIETFRANLEAYSNLGADLKEFCDTKESLPETEEEAVFE